MFAITTLSYKYISVKERLHLSLTFRVSPATLKSSCHNSTDVSCPKPSKNHQSVPKSLCEPYSGVDIDGRLGVSSPVDNACSSAGVPRKRLLTVCRPTPADWLELHASSTGIGAANGRTASYMDEDESAQLEETTVLRSGNYSGAGSCTISDF